MPQLLEGKRPSRQLKQGTTLQTLCDACAHQLAPIGQLMGVLPLPPSMLQEPVPRGGGGGGKAGPAAASADDGDDGGASGSSPSSRSKRLSAESNKRRSGLFRKLRKE